MRRLWLTGSSENINEKIIQITSNTLQLPRSIFRKNWLWARSEYPLKARIHYKVLPQVKRTDLYTKATANRTSCYTILKTYGFKSKVFRSSCLLFLNSHALNTTKCNSCFPIACRLSSQLLFGLNKKIFAPFWRYYNLRSNSECLISLQSQVLPWFCFIVFIL